MLTWDHNKKYTYYAVHATVYTTIYRQRLTPSPTAILTKPEIKSIGDGTEKGKCDVWQTDNRRGFIGPVDAPHGEYVRSVYNT